MANIKVSNLQPTGFGLLEDSESFLQELSVEDKLENVVGGTSLWTTITLLTLLGGDTKK